MATENNTTPIKSFDEQEVSLIVGEIFKQAWSICDAARLLKNRLVDEAIEVEPGGTTPYVIIMLTDAIYRLGNQQGSLAFRLEEELGVNASAGDTQYNLVDVPEEGKRLSSYIIKVDQEIVA